MPKEQTTKRNTNNLDFIKMENCSVKDPVKGEGVKDKLYKAVHVINSKSYTCIHPGVHVFGRMGMHCKHCSKVTQGTLLVLLL
jgi:hypothetical protein